MANYSFSVAMCTYNGARFLREQLASIAAQTELPCELIVCDDGSLDDSVLIIRDFAESAPFPVRIQVNEENLGLTQNFGMAVGLCSGDVIALSDQDDIWVPHKIARLDTEFGRSEFVGLVFSDGDLIDENSRPVGQTLWESLRVQSGERERLARGCAITELLRGSIVTGATMAFRGRFRDLVLPLPNNLTLIHDGWIALLISAVARIASVDEPLIKYRQHTGQQVGAVARKAPERGLINAVNRVNPYKETLAIAQSVRQRLLERRDTFHPGTALPDLEARIAHLEMRADLPIGHFERAQCVLRDLFALRYHRYSKGVSSAIKDLLVRNERTRS